MSSDGPTEGTSDAKLHTIENNDGPSQEQMTKLLAVAKSVLNPNGDNPQVDEYLNGSFNYILEILHKMATTNDKDATAREITEDLNTRFQTWAEAKKAEVKAAHDEETKNQEEKK